MKMEAVANDPVVQATYQAWRRGGTLKALVQFPNPADKHLWLALVDLTTYPAGNDGGSWVVWSYNAQDEAFYSGHYHMGRSARNGAYAGFYAQLGDLVQAAQS